MERDKANKKEKTKKKPLFYRILTYIFDWTLS